MNAPTSSTNCAACGGTITPADWSEAHVGDPFTRYSDQTVPFTFECGLAMTEINGLARYEGDFGGERLDLAESTTRDEIDHPVWRVMLTTDTAINPIAFGVLVETWCDDEDGDPTGDVAQPFFHDLAQARSFFSSIVNTLTQEVAA